MSIRYLTRVIDDIDYHVKNNYDYTSLLKINDDIEKAKKLNIFQIWKIGIKLLILEFKL